MEVRHGMSGKDPGQRKLFHSSILCTEFLNSVFKYGILHLKYIYSLKHILVCIEGQC